MRRRVAATLAMVVGMALVVAVGCNDAVRLGDDDAGTEVTLATGDVLELVLTSNPTTGYSWSAAEIPAFLELEGEAEYDSDAPPTMMGAGGEETWRFRATGPGDGELVLEYRRPWETDEPPIETYEVIVRVE